jgi:putative holliday junction resolvase
MSYILAIDYGLRFVGLSIASMTLKIPLPLDEVDRKGLSDQQLADEVLTRAQSRGRISHIIIGLPQHMDNKDSVLSEAARKFGSCFEGKTEAKVEFLDERLTSRMAHALFMDTDITRSKRSKVINSVSATILLQNYLDAHF